MSNVPKINTQYRNGFIGYNRPIYGNELVPDGGCLPEGYGPGVIVNEGPGGNQIFLWEMTDYSGGSLTSAYIDTNTPTDFNNHSSYYINTPLSGISYPVYQGYSEDYGTPATLISVYNVDENGYTFAVWAYSPYEINPIYGGDATSSIITDIGISKNAPTIINDRAYLPDTIYTNGGLPVSYTGTSCQQITPTPTPTSGLQPSATPSPTPTITPTQSKTPTPTPSITASLTPTPSATPVCVCKSYSVQNTGETQSIVSWLDCFYQPQEQTLDSGLGISFCACEGTLSVGRDDVITDFGSCSPVASPTPTPSHTPTPTPSGYPYVYEVSNCDNPLEVRVFGSSSFLALGKVVRASTITGCFEVVGSSSNPVEDYVISSYTDCGSCPR